MTQHTLGDGVVITIPAGAVLSGGSVIDGRQVYGIADMQITSSGQALQFFAGNHYCEPLDVITLSGRIADDNGDTVANISLPVTVKMPVVRHANGQPTGDEIYLNVTIHAGVISATGKIERSGDWKILQDRVNESLQRIGASWKLSAPDITILA